MQLPDNCDNSAMNVIIPATVGYISIELSRYIWLSLKGGSRILEEVTSINYNRSPLVQSGLEIPVEITLHWEDERALEILKRETEVSYSLGETRVSRSIKRHFELDFKQRCPIK